MNYGRVTHEDRLVIKTCLDVGLTPEEGASMFISVPLSKDFPAGPRLGIVAVHYLLEIFQEKINDS